MRREMRGRQLSGVEVVEASSAVSVQAAAAKDEELPGKSQPLKTKTRAEAAVVEHQACDLPEKPVAAEDGGRSTLAAEAAATEDQGRRGPATEAETAGDQDLPQKPQPPRTPKPKKPPQSHESTEHPLPKPSNRPPRESSEHPLLKPWRQPPCRRSTLPKPKPLSLPLPNISEHPLF